ncbi:MAG: hypothetical protein GX822_01725 [Alcaligenaceae bacterium]|jgi:hypothetical protein|nr:hypothetical protein [Alcaligenaceae bacterium]HZJ97368.1 hypothetical protein [Oligella sp.]
MKKTFTVEELDALAKTADVLSAWTGKCILCEKNVTDDGVEVAIFAQVLDSNEATKNSADADESVDAHAVEDKQEGQFLLLGGTDSDILGNAGGLSDIDTQIYECRLLFSIMFNAEEGEFEERFILVNDEFELVTTSDSLEELVPFSLREVDDLDEWGDEDWDNDDEDEDDDAESDDELSEEEWLERHRLHPHDKDNTH